MRNSILLSVTLILLNLSSNSVWAQEYKHCATDESLQLLLKQHPELIQTILANENAYTTQLNNKSKTAVLDTQVYIIPVVFHVLHENGPENISDAQIIDAIAVLNRNVRKLNPDTINVTPAFKNLMADIRLEFRLAKLDPQGNCTNGIDRVYTSKTNYGNDSAKVNPWPRDKYLNIWTVKALAHHDWAAYAYYPSASVGSMSQRDGIITLHNYVGSIGTSTPYTSRTLTHEVGHWLDLGHPWNRTINISINVGLACGDDLISDTPITKGHTTCPDLLTPGCMVDTFSNGSFQFNALTVSSGTIDPTPIDTLYNQLTIAPFAAFGVSSNPSRDSVFSFSDWPLGAMNGEMNFSALTGTLNPSKYYEVTIAPKLPYSMSLAGLTFNVNRSNTGPRTYAIRSSADGFASNLTASLSPLNSNLSVNANNVFFYNTDTVLTERGSKLIVSGIPFTNKGTPITFRIYAWNAENTLGSFGIDSVSIIGSAATIENIQNFMEYSYCENMFTIGQRDRMRLAIQSSISDRSNLWSSANLIATGVLNPTITCAPQPDFYASRTRICKGNSIVFTKNILNGIETNRTWTFQGGTPATSSSTNPTVTYNTPGTYSVTLTATNAAGTATVTKTQYIRVDNTVADIDYNGSYTEGFENPTVLNFDWQSHDYDNNGHTWYLANNAGINNTNAVGINAYDSYIPDVDELVSPSFDLTNNPNPALTFKIAAASKNPSAADAGDELKVFLSTTCGNIWILRSTYTGTALVNNPSQTTPFVPNPSSIWDLKTVNIPTTFQTSNVRFKFQYKSSNWSNNVYIDNINLSQALGVNENMIAEPEVTIYPNPSNNQALVRYHLNSSMDVKMELMDVLGKKISEVFIADQKTGDHTFLISKQEQKLNSGIYFVRLLMGNSALTRKLIITE